jgi:hypothetical protein
MKLSCLSVVGGWQSRDEVSGLTFGPVFNKVGDLWEWQRENVTEDMMVVKNLMSGQGVLIEKDTPWCCNPASETYWSM